MASHSPCTIYKNPVNGSLAHFSPCSLVGRASAWCLEGHGFTGADPEVFERGSPEAIIYKNLERGGPKSLKMAFECSFLSFSYKSFANIPPKGGARAPWAPPLNPPLVQKPYGTFF